MLIQPLNILIKIKRTVIAVIIFLNNFYKKIVFLLHSLRVIGTGTLVHSLGSMDLSV